MAVLSKQTISTIKTVATPERVVEVLGIPTKKYGRLTSFLCLKHSDKNFGSCFLTPSGWKCFACGESGDVIELTKLYLNVDFYEAAIFLCNSFGIKYEDEGQKDKKQPKSQIIDKETLDFLGIKSSGYSVEHVTGIVSETYCSELQQGERLEWHPFTDEDRDTLTYKEMSKKVYKPTGYYLVKQTVCRNPLVELFTDNPQLYHKIIYDKAAERLEVYTELKKQAIDNLPPCETRNIIIKSLKKSCDLCKKIMISHKNR